METKGKVYNYINKDLIKEELNDKNVWVDSINGPDDIELEELTVLVPKVIADRFKDAKTFVGEQPQYKLNSAYTISTRLAKFMLRYHKLCTRSECRVLNGFLNLPIIKKLMRDYDNGRETFDSVVKKIKEAEKEANEEMKKEVNS